MIPPDDTDANLRARYYHAGFASIEDFLSRMPDGVLRFEDDSVGTIASGRITCTREQLRKAKGELLDHALSMVSDRVVDYVELGVMNCNTFNAVMLGQKNPGSRFYGYDTFDGLPEPWVQEWGGGPLRMGREKGELAARELPPVIDHRGALYRGTFQDTLIPSLADVFPHGRDEDRLLFINVDCDIYSGALFGLTVMHPLLRHGDIVYFDEFFDAWNEFAAFNDYVRAYECRDWFVPIATAYDGVLFRLDYPGAQAPEKLVQASSSYLARLNASVRARYRRAKRHR